MPEMDLKHPGFTYSVCGPFTKNKDLKNLCRLEIDFIYRNDLDKASFQHEELNQTKFHKIKHLK